MENFISIQQMYQSWLDIANRVEQVTAKLDSGINVADTNVKSELEAIKAQLNGTLSVQDAGLLVELAAVKAKLDAGIDVADAALKSELEAMKAQLAAIEARLDETLDVKLTGSNVEELFREEALIASNAIYETTDLINVNEYSRLNILLINLNSNEHRAVVYVRWRDLNGITLYYSEDELNLVSVLGVRSDNTTKEIVSPRINLRVRNRSENEENIRIVVMGVKR